MSTIKAVGYVRVTTENKKKEVANQTKLINRYCKRLGFEIIDVYTEYALSSNENRNVLKMAINEVKRNNAILVITSLDRLSRNIKILNVYAKEVNIETTDGANSNQIKSITNISNTDKQ